MRLVILAAAAAASCVAVSGASFILAPVLDSSRRSRYGALSPKASSGMAFIAAARTSPQSPAHRQSGPHPRHRRRLPSLEARGVDDADSYSDGRGSDTATNVQQRTNPQEETLRAFLRFSPLVGGPSFLPLHMEVVLVTNGGSGGTGDGDDEEAASSIELHRFDFLPATPTDPSTLARLATLRSVPGMVRYRQLSVDWDRCLERGTEGRFVDTHDSSDVHVTGRGESMRSVVASMEGGRQTREMSVAEGADDSRNDDSEQRGVSLALPIGIFVDDSEGSATSQTRLESVVVSSAVAFADRYRSTDGRELRVLFGKNCASFAIDLLRYLTGRHGMRIV